MSGIIKFGKTSLSPVHGAPYTIQGDVMSLGEDHFPEIHLPEKKSNKRKPLILQRGSYSDEITSLETSEYVPGMFPKTAKLPRLIIGPYTWSNMADEEFWVPVYSRPDMASMSVIASGATINSLNFASNQLLYYLVGMISRGHFVPSPTNGIIDVTINFDSYNPAALITANRWWRLISLFIPQASTAWGISYGCRNAGGKEECDNISLNISGGNDPSVKINYGDNAIVGNNSSVLFRIKLHYHDQTNQALFCVLHTYANINAGAFIYGGDLTDAQQVTDMIQMTPIGFRLFSGFYFNTTSGATLARARLFSIVLNEGIYIP